MHSHRVELAHAAADEDDRDAERCCLACEPSDDVLGGIQGEARSERREGRVQDHVLGHRGEPL